MYPTQTFNLPELKGISKRTVEEHLKLFASYVKFTNIIMDVLKQHSNNNDTDLYILTELKRRFSFEWNGMRNHEYYFKSLEYGAKTLAPDSALRQKIEDQYGSVEAWLTASTSLAQTRGVGWAMVYYDPHTGRLTLAWVDEHHNGQLGSLPLVLALDMWEHAFLIDYSPAEKKKYITAFFGNLNWNVIEKNYLTARG